MTGPVEAAKAAGDYVSGATFIRTAKEAAEEMIMDDPVNHPSHYTEGGIECFDAIQASMSEMAFDGFLKGNAMKYIWRYEKKGKAVEDLDKANWYLTRLRSITCNT